jgi:C4-dicarboxylate-binding protein DctP
MAGASRIRRCAFGTLLVLLLASCGGPPAQRLYVIKFPHVTAPATPKGQTAERFKQLAEAKFPGRVRVEIYPSAQLMDDSDAIEALAFGEIQMTAAALSLYDRLTPKFQLFDLPFLFPDIAAVERFQHTPVGQTLLTALTRQGMLGLTFWHNGMKHLTGPRALRRPEDAAGLKFRIMESDVLQAQVLALGGSPQKMAFSEVYQALQTGTVDAQENSWSNIYSSKLYEVQPYTMETNHGYIGYLVAVNADFWESLPDDIRTGLTQILAEVTEWGNTRAAQLNLDDKQRVIDTGATQIVELSDEELAAWRTVMRPVWNQFRDAIGAELLDGAERSAAGDSSAANNDSAAGGRNLAAR